MAVEEVNAAYISVTDHESELREAHRLIHMTTQRYPLAVTETQCRDAHQWLAKQAND